MRHTGDRPRVVLIVDVWHPEMTHEMRLKAAEDEEQRERYMYRRMRARKNGVKWDYNLYSDE